MIIMHGHRNYNLHHQLITIALSNPQKHFMEDSKPVKSLGQCQPDILPDVGNIFLLRSRCTNQQINKALQYQHRIYLLIQSAALVAKSCQFVTSRIVPALLHSAPVLSLLWVNARSI